MFDHTRPAELDARGGEDPWAPFRVHPPAERLRLLRELRDGSVPVLLSNPGGITLTSTLWTLDTVQHRLTFSADGDPHQLARMAESDEATAVAYCDSVKLQFDLQSLMVVRGAAANALQGSLPSEIYRFQRRNAFRVRPPERLAPMARLRHPSMPEMTLGLRIVDISIGGCALWLPHDVPALQAGTLIGAMRIELDAQTRFTVAARVHHVSSHGREGGARLGCEWQSLAGDAERALQRWIDQAQKRRRLLTLD